jgi:hypothetical protein
MLPIIVFYDGSVYWLASGFHRLRAHLLAGRKVILAEVRKGGLRDAILCACGQNAKHGLRRNNADLADAEWAQWSDRAIAGKCAVSPTMVRLHRTKFLAEARASDQHTEATPRTVSTCAMARFMPGAYMREERNWTTNWSPNECWKPSGKMS